MGISDDNKNEFEFKLSSEEQMACDKLDKLNSHNSFFKNQLPSSLLKGALWLLRNPDTRNPDRLHQAAHSLREIFYGLNITDNTGKKVSPTKFDAFKKLLALTLTEERSEIISKRFSAFDKVFNNVAHHFNEKGAYQKTLNKLKSLGIPVPNGVIDDRVLEATVASFIFTLRQSLVDYIEIHKIIDEILDKGSSSVQPDYLSFLFSLHFDTKNYFFSKADASWFDWLNQNQFLDAVKSPPESDSDERYYHSPEMEYLVRVSETHPDKFTNFFQSFIISTENFDIGILNRAIWATEKLPASELKKMANKIRDEEWVKLLGNVRNSGFQYDGMFETLVAANEWEGVLSLASALLKIKPKDKKEKNSYLSDRAMFYVDDLGYSKVYGHLVNVPEEFCERALELISDTVLKFEERNVKERGEIHSAGDNMSYLDVDFFTVSITEEPGRSSREEAKNIAATFRILLEKTIGENCNRPDEVKRLFKQFVESLPDSRSMWRLKLFVMSLCPEVFKGELKSAFFRLFEAGNLYHEIDGGTEYQKALHKGFGILTEPEQREYVSKTFDFFTQQAKDNPEDTYHLHSGWENLSSISAYLTPEEKELCKENFGIEIKPEYEPQPVIGHSMGGMVSDRSPENLSKYTVPEIVEHLKTDWTPKILEEKYKNDDFLHPRNAQGLGDAIKEDLKLRSGEYMANAVDFFDRVEIHPHYTYSLLRGVEEMLRNKTLPADFDWDGLFKLLNQIKESGISEEFDDEIEDGRWLSRWIPVHDAIADILLNAQTATFDDVFPFDKYRDDIFDLIKYCSKVNDPKPENETSEYGDLHGIAINSVKGRAFQVFTHFVHYDGKSEVKEVINPLKEDIKELYLDWLKSETSKAVRYMFGYYLQPYYFRDTDWFKKEDILGLLFEKGKDEMSQASWEGYLNQSLHEELFNLLESKYLSSLTYKEEKDEKHSRERSFDELIGTHAALAFVHFDKFTLESDLFKALWERADTEKQKEFLSFIGRHFAHRDDNWRAENKVDIEKLKGLWDWILNNVDETEVFSGFGHWVAHERDSFDIVWLVEQVRKTVVKSKGDIDWDYGIIQNLEKFANVNPKATLEILEHYLLEGDSLNPHRERWFMIDRELLDALTIIYQDPSLKDDVRGLINRLMNAGEQQFWSLKDILD